MEPIPQSEILENNIQSVQDGSPSEFSQNPLVEDEYSFAKAPDGRFCEA